MNSAIRIGCLSLASLLAVSCGGGGSGGDNKSSSSSQSFSSASSSIANNLPLKSARETFFDMFGLYPGLYEVAFEKDGAKVITQGRVHANEQMLGPYWGFMPYMDVCNVGQFFEGKGSHVGLQFAYYYGEVEALEADGVIRTDMVNSEFELVSDPTNRDILRGTRWNQQGESVAVTMHRLSDEKNYQGGTVNLTTSFEGREVIQTTSVCWGLKQTPVYDIDNQDVIAFYAEEYFINVFPEKGDEFNPQRNLPVIGIDILEARDSRKGDNSQFWAEIYGPFAENGPQVYRGSNDINREYDPVTNRYIRRDDTFRTGEHEFYIDMEGATGTDYEGLFVKGTVKLTAHPSRNP
jgi:hypothetical protein